MDSSSRAGASSRSTVVFLGGNGHCATRLALAQEGLGNRGVEITDVRYPGFEGRPRAPDLETFLRGVSEEIGTRAGAGPGIVYATGIGGLIALCLRARGELKEVLLILQAPVLWGLERRLMPRVMRMRVAQAAVGRVFASRAFQGWFVRQHFRRTPSPEMRSAFFDGYAQCAALPDLFAWFTPRVLREIEREAAARPEVARNITAWWGGRDRVVTPRELACTERALGVRWPLRVFPEWGHYPMIDDPEAWAQAVAGTRFRPESREA